MQKPDNYSLDSVEKSCNKLYKTFFDANEENYIQKCGGSTVHAMTQLLAYVAVYGDGGYTEDVDQLRFAYIQLKEIGRFER